MISWYNVRKSFKRKGQFYTGSLTDEQITQIDKLYELGEVEVLKNELEGITLVDFQTLLPSIAYIAKRFIIGADTGLGKSLMIALFLKILKSKGDLKKALVVTTNSSLEQIKAVIETTTNVRLKYLPGEKEVLLEALSDPNLLKYDGFIVANSAFSKSTEFARYFNYLRKTINVFVFDESMEAANPNSIIHKAIKYWIKDCEYRLLCNATIIEKSVEQLYYQFDLLDPELMPPLETLKKTHEMWGTRDGKYKLLGITGIDKLLGNLKYHYKNISRIEQGLSMEYDDYMVPVTQTLLQRRTSTPQNYLFSLFSPSTQRETSCIPFDMESVPALKALVELVKIAIKDGGVVIYAEPIHCKDVIRKLLAEFLPQLKVSVIDGLTNDKDYVRNAFNAGVIDVVIINIPDALDLFRGKSMIFYTLPSKHYQARGRIARSLQDIKVKFYSIIYLNSHQSNYVKGTFSRDERTLDSALNRGVRTARKLAENIIKLESKGYSPSEFELIEVLSSRKEG